MPSIGRWIGSMSAASQASLSPSASDPTTIAIGPVRSVSVYGAPGVHAGRDDAHAAPAQPGEDLVGRRGGQRHREDRAGTGPDDVRDSRGPSAARRR